MSWIRENSFNVVQRCFSRILKQGQIPNHIGFIMDGNRRFAKKYNVEKKEGHVKGFDKLSETLQWCLNLGISEVTVYAFSIENFKRSDDEVSALMDLARDKFKRILAEKDKFAENGVRIRFIGNLSYLPDDIVALAAEAELMSKDNTKATLNVAFSYTAQDEMTSAVNTVLQGLHDNDIIEEDVDVSLISQFMHTSVSTIPEMIIRTSGESRLSDFLLFQGAVSYIYFTNVLWPEMSPWDFFSAIFQYQRVYKDLQCIKRDIFPPSQKVSPRACKFVEKVLQQKFDRLSAVLIPTNVE